MSLLPEHEYIYLAPDGHAQRLPGGPAFWAQPESAIAAWGRSWLVSEFTCDQDWAQWELHPDAEEFVYLLSGDIEWWQDAPEEGLSHTRLTDRGAVLVPRGVWHTARVLAPSRLLFITMGQGTQHRPVEGHRP